MKEKSKNNARIKATQFILIGGILIILTLMSSANWAKLPGNSTSTNLDLPNVADSQIPTLNSITPNSNINGFIHLSWSHVSNLQYYKVYESTSPLTESNITNHQYDAVNPALDEYYTDMEPNGTYYYVITTVNSTNIESDCSNCESVTVSVTVPTAPTLNAFNPNPTNSSSIIVCWSTVNNANSYEIYRSNSSITSENYMTLTPVANVWAPLIVWGDNVTTDGTYYYAIMVANEAGESLSNCQSVKVISGNLPLLNIVPPNAPTNLTITPNPSTNGSVTLKWNASNGATSYKIYRYTSPITVVNSSVTLVAITSDTTCGDNLTTSNTYYYIVVASNSTGDSAISNCVSVTVKLGGIPGFPLCIFLAVSVVGVGILFLKKKSRIKFA